MPEICNYSNSIPSFMPPEEISLADFVQVLQWICDGHISFAQDGYSRGTEKFNIDFSTLTWGMGETNITTLTTSKNAMLKMHAILGMAIS